MKRFCVFFLMLTALLTASAQRKVFISTSFHEPATDGLRFIYSYDGWQWKQVDGIWLRPEVGQQKVMRDHPVGEVTEALAMPVRRT